MNGRINFNIFSFLFVSFLLTNTAYAQNAKRYDEKISNRPSYTDSLINEFRNTIYYSLYNSNLLANNKTPTFTVLKIDIDDKGIVTGITFSDSADTLFVKTFLKRHKYHDDIATLEKYAKAKSYNNISIIIPVSYEPLYDIQNSFISNKVEYIMKFDGKDFTGKAIMLAPIRVGMLSKNNM